MPNEYVDAAAPGRDAGDLAAALAALPLAEPARSPLPRLIAALGARRRARWRRQWLPALAAAATLAALAMLPLAERSGRPARPEAPVAVAPEPGAARLAGLIADNRGLEAELRVGGRAFAAQSAGSALASAALEDLIGMLDLELSVGTGDAEAEALWAQRLVLLQELAAVRRGDTDPALDGGPLDAQTASYHID